MTGVDPAAAIVIRTEVTRTQLPRRGWGDRGRRGGGRTGDVHVLRARAKLAGRGPDITTNRGIGYRLDRPDGVLVVRDP
jgi:DNA-binding response OmpR family regulator